LYTNDAEQQFSYIEAAKAKGYDVLVMDGQLDVHLASMLEQKNEKSRYVRVDSDTIDNIILKENAATVTLTANQQNALSSIFKAELPEDKENSYWVSFAALDAESMPVMITQQEFMRRMKEMAATQGGMMSFYGQMPNSYNLVVNTNHALIKRLLENTENSLGEKVNPINQQIAELKQMVETINEANKDKKDDEIAETDKELIKSNNDKVAALEKDKEALYKEFAKGEDMVRQLVDLALLANNMLKGEALSKFVKRSTSFI
jgi:molecular chaperone HtpG